MSEYFAPLPSDPLPGLDLDALVQWLRTQHLIRADGSVVTNTMKFNDGVNLQFGDDADTIVYVLPATSGFWIDSAPTINLRVGTGNAIAFDVGAAEVARFDSEGTTYASRGTLDYAAVTADQGSITTYTDLTSLTVTVTPGTSRRIRVSGYVKLQCNTAGTSVRVAIAESSSVQDAIDTIDVANLQQTFTPSVILTPSAGAHTYKLACGFESGSGTIITKATSIRPNYILVEDIGPA